MHLTGLHLLLTYRCLYQCDHCFVWGGPDQSGTMTPANVDRILEQARELGTVEWIYYEGGEPFLYYPLLSHAVEAANRLRFKVGLVTNSYWADSEEEALRGLRPFSGMIQDLALSADGYHGGREHREQAEFVAQAAQRLGIPVGTISIAKPERPGSGPSRGKLPPGVSPVMFRGRAAAALAPRAPRHPWTTFDRCVPETLDDPGRVHIDPLGGVHLCQGIVIGNVYETSLRGILARFDPRTDPIVGPLLAGGPAELARTHDTPVRETYADCCHLCFETRLALRSRFPETLAPDQMYGDPSS